MKKISVDFISHNEPIAQDVTNAQLLQLMITIARIGLRVDSAESDGIIEMEIKHGSKEN